LDEDVYPLRQMIPAALSRKLGRRRAIESPVFFVGARMKRDIYPVRYAREFREAGNITRVPESS
jgi:hypothetical protein